MRMFRSRVWARVGAMNDLLVIKLSNVLYYLGY